MYPLFSVVSLLGATERGIFRTYVGLTVERPMTYRVYVRWPGQRVSHKTNTISKSVADAAWNELLSLPWDKTNMPLGLSYTHNGKQIEYIDLDSKDSG